MMSADTIGARLEQLQRASLITGAVALGGCAIGGVFLDWTAFFRSYLLAFLFWSGIPLGCLVVLMMHHLVGGGWGFLIRRPLEAATRTLPVVAVLVVPVLIGIHSLYTWSQADAVGLDPVLQYKHAYLNAPFFTARTIAYFVIWIAIAHFLNRWSLEQDRTGGQSLSSRLYALSAPGLIVYTLVMSLATLDWVMSLEPDWSSTIYAAVFIIGQVLSGMTLIIMLIGWLATRSPLAEIASSQYLIDLGNLLLAFVMLWAYMAFSQFLIIWSGNLPDEISWYLHRRTGGWQWIAALLAIGHFAVPFLLLLSRDIKRNLFSLSRLAGGLFVMRLIDMWWNVTPAFHPQGLHVEWMYGLAIVGVGGLWMTAFLRELRRVPLLPLHDPELTRIMAAMPEGAS